MKEQRSVTTISPTPTLPTLDDDPAFVAAKSVFNDISNSSRSIGA